ncbi:Glycine--tRNA ligase beta subunit [Candidatus Magnetomoraceae bacterium gMMP-15]
MSDLLFEIGSEEIPAGYINPALKAMSHILSKKLTDSRISFGEIKTMGTPRRLCIYIKDVAEKQESITKQETGPPKKVGFDENGSPKIPAQKFAEKFKVPIESIFIRETPKGEYLCVTISEKGIETKTLLKTILPEMITAIPFPKTMKWADFSKTFARPVQSLMALFDNEIIPFTWENIQSDRLTSGHFFMNPEKISFSNPVDYLPKLKKANVIVDIAERRAMIEKQIESIAKEAGGKVLDDQRLVDIVTNLVEYPAAVLGKFDTKFLEVPREVLITAMREHQKYFAVVDEKNNLMPCFIAVNNTKAKDMDLVAKGHERVLLARLSDARFFFKGDSKDNLNEMVEKLNGVLFQAKLGTMHEKILRVQKLAEFLADELQDAELKEKTSKAAWLCKSDLVSQVVGEFPKLQGIMGRIYADLAGESSDIAQAIEEHYRPVYSGGKLPENSVGAILAIADKLDTICGCFGVGQKPTGAADPYALRRQAIGIVQIMLDRNYGISLSKMIEKSLELFGSKLTANKKETAEDISIFFKNRITNMLIDDNFSKDVAASVLSVSVDHIPNIRNRAKALQQLKTAPDFEPLAVAFKRAGNIIKKAGDFERVEVNPDLFEDDCEKNLFEAFEKIEQKVKEHLQDSHFNEALLEIASLRSPVDNFFDGVMVMAEDKNLRKNRLALLTKIAALFEKFADFSKISD